MSPRSCFGGLFGQPDYVPLVRPRSERTAGGRKFFLLGRVRLVSPHLLSAGPDALVDLWSVPSAVGDLPPQPASSIVYIAFLERQRTCLSQRNLAEIREMVCVCWMLPSMIEAGRLRRNTRIGQGGRNLQQTDARRPGVIGPNASSGAAPIAPQ